MFKRKVVALALMLMMATCVYAGSVDDCKSNAGMMVGVVVCVHMEITICPQYDFELISVSCTGVSGIAYIWIEARDVANLPVCGIPWTDYWLNACDPAKQLFLCASPIVADSLTGANGRTSFSGRIAGGGCTQSGGVWIAIQGQTILAKPCPPVAILCLSISIKSPDLRGGLNLTPDGKVTVSDLVPFSQAYNTTEGVPPPPGKAFNACCDYNDDAKVNLSDFAFLGAHYTHKCQ